MKSQEHVLAERVEPVPNELESAQAKLVYLTLEVADGATVDELEQVLAMKKIDLLTVLRSLLEEEIIVSKRNEYVVQRDG
ncbi:MarR family transcriptional regulator [Natrialbaceae archaeon A-arb3/5]